MRMLICFVIQIGLNLRGLLQMVIVLTLDFHFLTFLQVFHFDVGYGLTASDAKQ